LRGRFTCLISRRIFSKSAMRRGQRCPSKI
jgi:hypothetical protein